MFDATKDLADRLSILVRERGMVAVLQTLAHIMAGAGNVTGGMVSEIAAIEEWLEAQHNPVQPDI
jgi:hypothetical protein